MSSNDTNTINEDVILGSLIKSGNQKAFHQLYLLYSKKLFGFAYSYLKSKSEAEEIIQSVFVRIWETRSQIREDVSLRQYLFTITINHIYNHFKHQKVKNNAAVEQLYLLADIDNSTIDKINFNNLQENINSLVSQLPEQRRVIFKLSREEGFSHEEIATKLQLSVRTVESQIYKALKFLKTNLKEDLTLLFFLAYFF